MKKVILIITVFLLIIIFTIPGKIIAQVVINEFQISPSTNQWIELFNAGTEDIDISGWVIDDSEGGSASVFTIPSGVILPANKCISFASTNFNWNLKSSDQVRLISPSNIESFSYSISPGDNISIGRVVDGQGNLVILSTQSKDAYNSTGQSCLAPTLTPTPTSSASPSQTPTPTAAPYKAIYKINSPKDDDNFSLNSVQIFVDGSYIHHEDDEVLYFFNGHECYTGIECNLGLHTVSLRKNGYTSWEDSQNFVAGLEMEVNPVLNRLETPTPTPIITPKPTITPIPPTSKISDPVTTSQSNNLTTTSAVLAIETSLPDNSIDTEVETSVKNKLPLFPFLIIGIGLFFITFSIFSIIKNAKKENSEIS